MNKQVKLLIVFITIIALISVIVVANLIPLGLLPIEDLTRFSRLFFATGALVVAATYGHIVVYICATTKTPSTEQAYWDYIDTFLYDSSWCMGFATLFSSVIGILCSEVFVYDKGLWLWMVVFVVFTFGSYIVAMLVVASVCQRHFKALFYERDKDILDTV